MTWKEAILNILQNNENGDAYAPMHYRDITNAIFEKGLIDPNKGKTPANSVSANLSKNPDLFENLGGGMYRLKELSGNKNSNKKENISENQPNLKGETAKPAHGHSKLIQSYGMYWLRDGIDWDNPKLWGIQSSGAKAIDLSEMRGVYMLYDGREVVYVGKSSETILKRLIQHTKNRLATRWNRFSWFGIDGINKDGQYLRTDDNIRIDATTLIEAMEGLLIEGLEPRQNRKQGDNFGFEYYQEIDKEIAKQKIVTSIQALL